MHEHVLREAWDWAMNHRGSRASAYAVAANALTLVVVAGVTLMIDHDAGILDVFPMLSRRTVYVGWAIALYAPWVVAFIYWSTTPLEPLPTATMRAWERIRHTHHLQTMHDHSATLRDYYESDPNKLPGIASEMLFRNAEPKIRIWGRSPPRTGRDEVPQGDFLFSDDGASLVFWYDREKAPNEQRRYVNLAVRTDDIDRRLRDFEV